MRMCARRLPGRSAKSKARSRERILLQRSGTKPAPCGMPQRGRSGKLTKTTMVLTCACTRIPIRTSVSGLDATSLDDLEVVAQLLGFSGLIPAEELLHARRDFGDHRLRVVG